MIYNAKKMKELISSIETYLSDKDMIIVREFLWQYNKMYLITRDKIKYIKRKEKQYADESVEHDSLVLKNKELKNKIMQKDEQIGYLKSKIKELEGNRDG